ncbi:hypothetical protein ACS5PN_03460 [Roseateles sp. NT4]|uniref:hypothetical protein n=1 Tax=Roseateles sp. NT4 TaxID=3453715 RepID=UPI003EEB79FB
MSAVFHSIEADVRRVWGALRFADAMSGHTVAGPLHVELPGARLQRNSSGLFVVTALDDVANLAARRDYENAFDPIPAAPAIALPGTVSDPGGRYLARRFTLALPRSPLPPAPGATPPLFEAATITLDPTAATALLPTWAALRLSVRRAGAPAAQAAIRVHRPGSDTVLGRGMTDARGEALVAVVGVAQVTPGADELVVETEIAVEIVISADTALAPGALVDPDLLAARAPGAGLSRLTATRNLASGRIEVMNLTLP